MSKDIMFGTIDRDYLTSGKYYVPIYHMDIEVLPKWWSITFRHKGKKIVFTSDNYELADLRKITSKAIITAYNAKKYDMKILYAILSDLPVDKIYELSDAIINNDGKSESPLIRRYLKSTFWGEIGFIDLFDDVTGSLKEKESNMGIAIVESKVPWWKKILTPKDKKDLLKYNHHDVVAQEKWFLKRVKGYLLPKIVLAEMFDINPIAALKNTNANLTASILKAKKISSSMTKDRPYRLPEHIDEYVRKYVPEEIIDTFLTTGMDKVNKKEMSFKDFDNKGKFGKGGLHSIMRKFMRVTNLRHLLILIDVRSYYPNLMIWFDFISRAVQDPKIVAKIYQMRVQAKRTKNKALDKALKLVLNTIFGATGQKWNHLFDPNQAWSVTITGQLLLYALAKELWLKAKCKIVQTNTDGILVGVKKENLAQVKEIVSAWEKMTSLEMDYENVEVFAQRDVNNYACKFTNGNTKVKGALCMQAITCDETAFEVVTYNNWDMRITHEAVFKYLIDKEPIEKTIRKCKDLMMFVSTCKTGSTYSHTYQYIDGKEKEIQKVNRVLAVKSSRLGTLKKFKITRGKKPRNCDNIAWNKLIRKLEDLKLDYELDVRNRVEARLKIKQINKELENMTDDEKLLKAIYLREQYDKIAKISEHSYIMNKDMNEYDWDTWSKRIDYDFYIGVAKDKVEGWRKNNESK